MGTVQRGSAEYEEDRTYEPACSAHLSGQIPQLPSADSNERHIHTRIHRLPAARRSISFFIHHYTRISGFVVLNTSYLRGTSSQFDREFFLCSEVFMRLAPWFQ